MSLISLADNSLTDKNSTHSYLEIYDKLFINKKLNTDLTLLEIGIQYGGSIKLWKDYFINGKIYGIDIDSVDKIVVKDIINDNKIKLFFNSNGYDNNIINTLFKDTRFDFIIDDGPHTLESMIFFIINYSKLLKEDGVLIIEDVQNIGWIETIKNNVPEDLKQYIEIIDNRNIKNRYDDILFIINKSNIKVNDIN
jgi:cephalosporin hydroxylase